MKPRFPAQAMTKTEKCCPKCGGAMELGFVLDNTYGARMVSNWSAGEPRKSFFFGTKMPREKQIPIGTLRCQACGFLESYALPEFGPT